jgi:hypothetical protein
MELTIESLRKFMEENAHPDPVKRNFVVCTGQLGKEMFDREMKREVVRRTLKLLRDTAQVTTQEFERITQMIESSDMENLVVAEAICDQKLHPSGKSQRD